MTLETLRNPPTRPESFTHSLPVTKLTQPWEPDESTSLCFILLGGFGTSAFPARIPGWLTFYLAHTDGLPKRHFFGSWAQLHSWGDAAGAVGAERDVESDDLLEREDHAWVVPGKRLCRPSRSSSVNSWHKESSVPPTEFLRPTPDSLILKSSRNFSFFLPVRLLLSNFPSSSFPPAPSILLWFTFWLYLCVSLFFLVHAPFSCPLTINSNFCYWFQTFAAVQYSFFPLKLLSMIHF